MFIQENTYICREKISLENSAVTCLLRSSVASFRVSDPFFPKSYFSNVL